MPICVSDLPFVYNINIAATVFNKCLYLKILGTEGIIIIKVMIVEAYKVKAMQKKIYILN